MTMPYLIAVFIPPLHFAIRNRWGAFAFSATMCLLSIPLLAVFGIGIFFWFIAAVHAMWDLRHEVMEEHATMIATKMAEKMKEK